METAHHEYLFDYRYKDPETGKLNTDKLGTINSEGIWDLMESHASGCYEYHVFGNYVGVDNSFSAMEETYNRYKFPEREKQLEKQRKAQERKERKRQEHIRCIYCGMYGKTMAHKECEDCLLELRAIKEKCIAKKANNVIPFRAVEVKQQPINDTLTWRTTS